MLKIHHFSFSLSFTTGFLKLWVVTTFGVTWANVGVVQNLTRETGFRKCQEHKVLQSDKESDVFVTVLTPTVSRDVTAALIPSTQQVHSAYCVVIWHNMAEHWNTLLQTQNDCTLWVLVFLLYIKSYINLIFQVWKAKSMFSYCHSLAGKYQPSIAFDCIVLEGLIFKITVWIVDLSFTKYH